MSVFYLYGQGVTVTTEGPGSIHLLTYASNASHALPAVVGTTTTTSPGTTRFIISHSYTFEKFAFYWDGAGTAVCGKGWEDVPVQPVGTSWAQATSADWSAYAFATTDVTSEATSAIDMANKITCFITASA
ncbi:hypothetical protein BDZ97DRAFT_1668855 [Flammula alnicola]|nr:hypothetical protein BDZ97DRAFT_1668855 [Flammula alnicola]